MFSTRKKKQSDRRFFSELEDFDRDIILAAPRLTGKKML